MDQLSGNISRLIALIPHLPVTVTDQLLVVQDGLQALAPKVGAFGAVIPFDVFTGCITVWVSLLSFWGIIIGIRAILWAVGR
jgi:hypothetical protein